jgi:hypothetical protein
MISNFTTEMDFYKLIYFIMKKLKILYFTYVNILKCNK